jgi:TolA-binding protein
MSYMVNMRDARPAAQEQMVKEISALRLEVQQLRQMVNMLLDIVVEPEEDDEWDFDPLNRKGDKGGRNMMCM